MTDPATSGGAQPPPPGERHGLLARAGLIGGGYLLALLLLSTPGLVLEGFRGIGWHFLPGLNLGMLVAFGLRCAPILVLGPLVNGLWVDPLPVGRGALVVWAFLMTFGSVAGAVVLRHGLGIDRQLRRLRDVNGLVLVALVQPLPVAALGVVVFAVVGSIPWPSYLSDVITWWIGGAIGTLTLTPFLLVHVVPGARALLAPARPDRAPAPSARTWRGRGPSVEGWAQAASIALAVWVPFSSAIASEVRLFYVGFLPLMWIALRRGLAGATGAILALNGGIVLAVRSTEAPPAGLADLQFLMLGLALTGLFLGAVTTERRRAEGALRASEARLRAVFDRALDAMVVVDSDGRYHDANPAATRLLGVPRGGIVGRTVFDFVEPAEGPDVREAWQAFLVQGEQQGVVRLRRPDGTIRDVDYAATAHFLPGRHLSVLRDVTERRQLEAELRQSQKTEAVGRLAGGIAHDFNNLLAVIIGYAETMVKDLPGDDPLRHDAEEIRTAAGRAASLTRQLLAFSRRQALQLRLVDLNAILAGIDATLRELLGDELELAIVPGPLAPVHADPGQMRQVILNLAVNARDAMPQGGRLILTTAEVTLDAVLARRHGTQPGRYVQLQVSDTGCGMEPEVQAHLFEPFFTTREVGQGTGLGLSVVYGIVRDHQGFITVDSRPGRGSTFTIYLPRVAASSEAAAADPTAARPPAGVATILVVEDDLAVRQLIRGVLSQHGYTVLEAANSGEALFISEWHEDPIDLLVAAWGLPQLGGWELAARLGPARPDMRVLYVASEAAELGGARGAGADPAWTVLRRPFTLEALLRQVREALEAPRDPGRGRGNPSAA